jgi:L-ascorbate metabolism protein UlaG (beta-lactamase superfamily)
MNLLGLIVVVMPFVMLASTVHYMGKKSDHFDGKQFHNLNNVREHSSLEGLYWFLTRKSPQWPTEMIKSRPFIPPVINGNDVVVTYVNHATCLIQSKNINILTDPIYSNRASPLGWLGPTRVHEPGVPYDQLPHIDVVLISHDHYDHMDKDTVIKLKNDFDPLFIVPLGNAIFLRNYGITKIKELDWWDTDVDQGVTFTLVPAQHFSSRFPSMVKNGALWGGYVIKLNHKLLYFAGDSGYGPNFKMIHDKFGDIDFSMLPIGSFAPRWFMKTIHVNPEEAVRAHIDLHSAQSIGIHFKTFQLSEEDYDAPVIGLETAKKEHHIAPDKFIAPEFGQSFYIRGSN